MPYTSPTPCASNRGCHIFLIRIDRHESITSCTKLINPNESNACRKCNSPLKVFQNSNKYLLCAFHLRPNLVDLPKHNRSMTWHEDYTQMEHFKCVTEAE